MSVGFRAVQWNGKKLVYDGILLAAVALYIAVFIGVGRWVLSSPNDPAAWDDLRIRAFGSCAFIMLTVLLVIGPLCRLDPRFLPLLYNRRHFGVLTFGIAALHGWFIVDWFWSRGKLTDLVGEVTNWPAYLSFPKFPFEALGITALVILFLMAATSHDFWQGFLTPRAWKALHMAVYVAYGLLVMHIALGVMQDEHHWIIPLLLGCAFAGVTALHLLAARRERAIDHRGAPSLEGWIEIGPPLAIPNGSARIVTTGTGERIAVFRDGDRIGALTNLCAHQNGPLGEGRIIDGCVTCPWHGYQYRLEDGCAPPPFGEKLATYRLRLNRGLLEVDPRPLPPGMRALLICPPVAMVPP